MDDPPHNQAIQDALAGIVGRFSADSGTVHLLGDDGGLLHLQAAAGRMPDQVLQRIRVIPVGKGMAGLAVQRNQPVTACNIQTDETGDVRPGAKLTGLEGAIVVPIRDQAGRAIGALGIANHAPRDFTEEEQAALIESAGLLPR